MPRSKKIRIADLPEFDVTEYLNDEQAMVEYLTIVIEENDPGLLAAALGDVARARGMSEIDHTLNVGGPLAQTGGN